MNRAGLQAPPDREVMKKALVVGNQGTENSDSGPESSQFSTSSLSRPPDCRSGIKAKLVPTYQFLDLHYDNSAFEISARNSRRAVCRYVSGDVTGCVRVGNQHAGSFYLSILPCSTLVARGILTVISIIY